MVTNELLTIFTDQSDKIIHTYAVSITILKIIDTQLICVGRYIHIPWIIDLIMVDVL